LLLAKLTAMKHERDAMNAGTGRDLIVVKQAVIDEALAKLGMRFGKPRGDRAQDRRHRFRGRPSGGSKPADQPGGQNGGRQMA